MRYLNMISVMCLWAVMTMAQQFTIETVSDSLSYLVLTTDSTTDRHRLPFEVYQFCTGDVDGDGRKMLSLVW